MLGLLFQPPASKRKVRDPTLLPLFPIGPYGLISGSLAPRTALGNADLWWGGRAENGGWEEALSAWLI